MRYLSKISNSILLLILYLNGNTQDTLNLKIKQADSLFISNSFYLLASSMNIEAEKAKILQAKLYPNPVFTAEINVYDPENNRAFHIGNTGQMVFTIEQLILLGGKRKTEIELAKKQAELAEIEFTQLVQNLKYQLRSNLFTLGQQEFLLAKLNEQADLLNNLLNSYQTQVNNGNIPLKDLVRLKTAFLKLNNEKAELYKEYLKTQTILQQLLQVNSIIKFDFNDNEIEQYIKTYDYNFLVTNAEANNPDLSYINTYKEIIEKNLKYQKKLIVPDINFFISYDQRGGAFQNQINSGFSIPIPIWNRNQGNIKSMKYQLNAANYEVLSRKNEILSMLQNSYLLYNQSVKDYNSAKKLYNEEFDETIKGISNNFQKRNISIIEFIDFFESYNQALNELTRIKVQLVNSAEELNLITGKALY